MISVNELTKIYNDKKTKAFTALENINLHIKKGEMVAIMGKSGAGKSTLLHILGCIDKFNSGSYKLNNIEIEKQNEKILANIRNTKIGIVMQNFALVDDYTVTENVEIPLNFSTPKNKKNTNILVTKALKTVGMDDYANYYINKLSGGQKQRVAIARAIVNNPSVILADEPTGALDTKTASQIMQVFKDLHNQGNTIVIITHDLNVANLCDRIINICDGKIVE